MTVLERAKVLLGFARYWTMSFLRGIPEDRYTWQPWAGANHVTWTLGHLMVTDNWILKTLGGADRDPDGRLAAIYGMGSRPEPDAARYLPPEELKRAMAAARQELLQFAEQMSEEELLRPNEGDLQRFAPDRVGMLYSLAWHEGMHGGQLTAIRKALGLPPIIG